jgi:uncharacterized protein
VTAVELPAIDAQGALAIVLTSQGARANATSGRPVESKHVLYEDLSTEVGVWEVTPGAFPARKDGVWEMMQFVSGRGRIIHASGVTEIEPGVVLFTPDGWTGTWEVEETVRKVYVLHQTRVRLRGIGRTLYRRSFRSVHARRASP